MLITADDGRRLANIGAKVSECNFVLMSCVTKIRKEERGRGGKEEEGEKKSVLKSAMLDTASNGTTISVIYHRWKKEKKRVRKMRNMSRFKE